MRAAPKEWRGRGAAWLTILLTFASGLPARAEAGGPGTSSAAVAPDDPVDERQPVEVPQPGKKALSYYRTGMVLWSFNEVWGVALPAAIAFSGISARLRDGARRAARAILLAVGLRIREAEEKGDPVGDGCAGSRLLWFLTVGLYVVAYLGLVFLIELPIAYAEGFVRPHAYGLSNQTHAKWFSDSLTHLAVAMVVGFGLTWVPYLLLRKAPRCWWAYTAALSVPFLFVTVLVKPIWIDPLFNRFGPMQDRRLERAILDLAARAGIEGSRVFEVDKSVDTNAVNAYVTGVLGTKRIVLWDTLLTKLNRREVLFVMAHEMGHYVLGHVVRSILLSSVVTLAGLYLVHRLGNWLVGRYSGRLGFRSLADVASVPLLLALLHLTGLFLSPVVYAYSRIQEHEADRFALDLTRTNHSGAMSFVKLQRENLSNPRPGPIYRIFRASHPSIGERIDFCNSYQPSGLEPSATVEP
jgi:Zn-dependent protease with chaperone function